MEGEFKERITSEKALEILNKNGLSVTLEQAKVILEFLYKIANIAVAQHLKNENS